jgi:diaminohydroxyphosphoribosylaminopyrimidine deaminase/5-amino-6-(5-phosphoribosylamino)uracil reductase
LAAAGPRAEGADVFVTLEPCARRSNAAAKSCTQLLVEARVRRVVIAAPDPHALAGGAGVRRLRASGVIVEEGLLADAAIRLNVGFFTVVRLGRPFVAVDQDASGYDSDFELGFRETFEEALARMARNGLTRVRVAPGTPLAAALSDRGLIDDDLTGTQPYRPVRG